MQLDDAHRPRAVILRIRPDVDGEPIAQAMRGAPRGPVAGADFAMLVEHFL